MYSFVNDNNDEFDKRIKQIKAAETQKASSTTVEHLLLKVIGLEERIKLLESGNNKKV